MILRCRSGRIVSNTVAGRRHCRVCGCWRHLIDFPPRKWSDDAKTIIKYVQSECDACRRIAGRERYEQQTSTQRKRRNRTSRAWHRRERRQAGVPEIGARVVSHKRTGTVRREPFARWLRQALDEKRSATVVARKTGLSERRIHVIINGYETTGRRVGGRKRKLRTVDFVDIDTVAGALMKWGEPWLLDELYPLEEDNSRDKSLLVVA